MEPWAASYAKLVPCLDDEVLGVIKVIKLFLIWFLGSMSSLEAFGLGMGAVRQTVLNIFELATESSAVSLCCALLSLKLPDSLISVVLLKLIQLP